MRMSTDEVAPKDRADWYQDVLSKTVARHTLAIDDPKGSRARVLSLGQVEVSRHCHAAHPGTRCRRRPAAGGLRLPGGGASAPRWSRGAGRAPSPRPSATGPLVRLAEVW
ncbi:hypothetical protein AB0K48_59355 [Nonomuraea sp. NPDC055795]